MLLLDQEEAMPGQRGTGQPCLAYVRVIKSESGASWYRAIPLLKRGQLIFALHDADGRLIAIADSREAALAGAATFRLEALSLH